MLQSETALAQGKKQRFKTSKPRTTILNNKVRMDVVIVKFQEGPHVRR
jgi:hypothetical protein